MARAIDLDNAMDIATLYDWYISSVSQDDEPVWTEKHIDELFRDFYVIPKETPTIEAEPVKHGKWLLEREPDGNPNGFHCSVCDGDFHNVGIRVAYDYCPFCGARMDGE